MSTIRRRDGIGGKMYVPRDRYSLTMSFCVVPRSSARRHPLLLGIGDVQREQPRRGGVDRHRGVHLAGRDLVEQRAHVAEVGHRHADLADLATRHRRVRVVAGLRGQVERDRQAGLALAEVRPVELVGGGGAWSGPSRSASTRAAHASCVQCGGFSTKSSSLQALDRSEEKNVHAVDRYEPVRPILPPPWDGRRWSRGFPSGGNPVGRMADSAGDGLGAGGGGPPALTSFSESGRSVGPPTGLAPTASVEHREVLRPGDVDGAERRQMGVVHCTSSSSASRSRSQSSSAISATFDASVSTWNIDSPAKSRSIPTPYSPPTSCSFRHTSMEWAQPRSYSAV